ncbi:hypothetical protein CRG98_009432 [Punica granatum]|uniref:Retrotransposon Copia-like N-terminal domain-containing protein n=1 Tax=Punica granatum TaxID=22663 RepID=A0A2I0KNY1_PUNGR|nr:hypothetical protein CRG98_009432 [Punica granatum]
MQIALRAKNKIGFIDGTLPEPVEGNPNKASWVMVNSTVITWIVNTLEKDLQPSVACIENARVLWDDLKQRFSQDRSLNHGFCTPWLDYGLSSCVRRSITVPTSAWLLPPTRSELSSSHHVHG